MGSGGSVSPGKPLEDLRLYKEWPDATGDENFQLMTKTRAECFDWDFDVFGFSTQQLLPFTVIMLNSTGLPAKLAINLDTWSAFMFRVHDLMSNHVNPYHNIFHIADVFQACCVILETFEAAKMMGDIENFGILVGALVHDLEHPGTNNTYQINASTPLAIRYNDLSVLENHHAAKAFEVFGEEASNIFENFSPDNRKKARKVIITTVLATDMAHHFSLTDEMTVMGNKLSETPAALDDKQMMTLAKGILHIADISNPARPFGISKRWSDLVMEEFFAQGDKEIEDGGFPTMNCDRVTTLQDELSLNFLDFIVAPIYFSTIKLVPKAAPTVKQLRENRDTWHTRLSERLSGVGEGDTLTSKWEPRKKGFDTKFAALNLDGSKGMGRSASSSSVKK